MPRDTRSLPRLPHSAIVKAPGLLPMQYRLAELADELAVSPRVVREWMERGLTYTQDGQGHLWIDGRHVIEWVSQIRNARKKRGQRLALNEAYCLRCRQAIKLNPTRRRENGKQVLVSGQCPNCAGVINRGIRRDQQG